MDLQEYSMKDLLLTAIKSEEDNYQLYSTLDSKMGDDEISSNLEFLAGEEKKHRALLERIFFNRFPDLDIRVDEIATDVPLPMIDIAPGNYPVGDLLSQVMEAEKITADFYSSWKEIQPEQDKEMNRVLEDLSKWEMTHYDMVKEMRDKKRISQKEIIW
jgi:rubrerythrin